jgi:aerobic carbon-monoxide dehydrogenase medium subunit
MFPRAFHYHRAGSLKEAATMLAQLGPEAKLLAGGQSLIPLMKLRFASPPHLVDLNFVPGAAYVKQDGATLRLGALTCHADIENSPAAAAIPILHDCAAGIADVQIRNRGTIGGSVAEADPSGDWAPVLLTLEADVRCLGPRGGHTVPISKFFVDAYTSALGDDELISEIAIKTPAKGGGGAYLAFKRSAPVYASASAAVRVNMEDGVCRDASIVLGAVGLTPVQVVEGEAALRNNQVTAKTIEAVAEAARATADPQPDMRGSADYKRQLVAALVKRALEVALKRARGEKVELGHIYA